MYINNCKVLKHAALFLSLTAHYVELHIIIHWCVGLALETLHFHIHKNLQEKGKKKNIYFLFNIVNFTIVASKLYMSNICAH